MSVEVECVLDAAAELGECPVWDGRTGRLYWEDIDGRTIHRFDPSTGEDEARQLSGRPGSFVLTPDPDRLVVAMELEVVDLTWSTGETSPRAQLEPPDTERLRLNDGRCDRQGRYWVGSMSDPPTGEETEGRLHRLDADGTAVVQRTGIGVSNGIAFSPDGTTMYFADSPTGEVWAYDYDVATGTPSKGRLFVDFAEARLPGWPDGACVDADGCYWSAVVFGRQLARITPDGVVDRTVDLPCEKPTMPAFGGPNLDTLYVTSIGRGGSFESAADDPHAGGVFALDPGVTGVPEPVFGGID